MGHGHAERGLTQLRRGTLEYCVLGVIAERERYGYELVGELAAAGGLLAARSSIYPVLNRLARDGLVRSETRPTASGAPERRYYTITPAGRQALAEFVPLWQDFSSAVSAVLSKGSTV